jgi:hypothetical protein
MSEFNKLVEYIKIHKLSLIQDMENVSTKYPKEYLQGAIACMDHILEVADEYNR